MENFDNDYEKLKNYLLSMAKYILVGNTVLIEIEYAYDLLKEALQNEILSSEEALMINKSLIISRVFCFNKSEKEETKTLKNNLKTLYKYLKQGNLPLDFGKYAAKNILIIEESKKEDNALARTIKL